jgi:hypothetical protein
VHGTAGWAGSPPASSRGQSSPRPRSPEEAPRSFAHWDAAGSAAPGGRSVGGAPRPGRSLARGVPRSTKPLARGGRLPRPTRRTARHTHWSIDRSRARPVVCLAGKFDLLLFQGTIPIKESGRRMGQADF